MELGKESFNIPFKKNVYMCTEFLNIFTVFMSKCVLGDGGKRGNKEGMGEWDEKRKKIGSKITFL